MSARALRLTAEDLAIWAAYESANKAAAASYKLLPIAAGRAKAVNICACGAQTIAQVCRRCRRAGL